MREAPLTHSIQRRASKTLAPEPAPAGEVPEVRLGAQVLAESVCSAIAVRSSDCALM